MAEDLIRASESHSKEWLFCLFALLLLANAGCARDGDTVQLFGATMGTTWSVTYQGQLPPEQAQSLIEQRLDQVNRSMSTYLADSEISRINAMPPGDWVDVSAAFCDVLGTALGVGRASKGAYDVTVGPLVDLWGFGASSSAGIPTQQAISLALTNVGQQRLALDKEQCRLRKQAPLLLDFSSLAKGYALDLIAKGLSDNGVSNFLVEIGGEMRVAGLSPRGDLWRIAIESPTAENRTVAASIHLSDIAVATSGDYRNYFEHEGRRYSHSIDPRSGWPVTHELVSVTVLHPLAKLADAWATALTVLGPQQALAVAQQHGLAVYFIRRDGEGFSHEYTKAFAPYLADFGGHNGD